MNRDETMVVDPTTGGQKGTKLARLDLIPPDTLIELAEHYGRGAAKHADRNWERGYKWSLSFAALNRHLWLWWGGEEYDEDEKMAGNGRVRHLAAVAWHAFTLLTFSLRGVGTDDRPRRTVTLTVEADATEALAALDDAVGPNVVGLCGKCEHTNICTPHWCFLNRRHK